MSSKTLSQIMRAAVIAVGICGLFVALYVMPPWGNGVVRLIIYKANNNWYLLWMFFAWLLSLPCFAVLGLVWKVSDAVRDDTVFTLQTAKWIKSGGILLLSDAIFFFTGSIIMELYALFHPGVLLLFMIGIIFVIALALMASVLSRYITKAAVLQEMNEGTI